MDARLLEEDNDQENALEGLDSRTANARCREQLEVTEHVRNIIQGKRKRQKAWPPICFCRKHGSKTRSNPHVGPLSHRSLHVARACRLGEACSGGLPGGGKGDR